ncbi:type I-F CRISPR-associated endoribonuclease Cas6/Csy4 [Marinomonas sp. CT5]|uniref:type I-F CRISPR-associated endoribonuclease Cas6/Csy4 n=1 Tax=Marinomonas sp. CT5 TaxID=2066133 RepID=UPI001BAF4C6E|nr:type I-F CRISPR-associated endoribonuclease Cas6/Csy4 [Marinomonas sp. CT5]QUX96925.1 type I-F CRISPR-associated endoribonuclease Cas6/Csy4 [Marinomonas sp. CT5]
MDSYIDIRIRPDAEMRENVLLNKVYIKFHKALFDLRSLDIGVSFPETKVMLGTLVRIHSSQERLEELMALSWLGGLSGYCVFSDIKTVPECAQYRRVFRWRPNMSKSHLRRLIKRGSILEHEMKAYKAKMFADQMTTLPYLEMESTSNGKHHRRYIKMTDIQASPQIGDFDYFGLSKTATIPWF